jgi:hypothetical protein
MTDSMYRHRPDTKTLVASELLSMKLCAASKTVQRPARSSLLAATADTSKSHTLVLWYTPQPGADLPKTLRVLLSSRMLKNG